MGIFDVLTRLFVGKDDSSPSANEDFPLRIGEGGAIDQPCSPGRFYVYLHKSPDGIVFYVGKGTGNRAYSTDRQPEWHEYVSKKLNGKFSVEVVRNNISESDAEQIEDAYMAKYAASIINRQNLHAPYDTQKMLAYSDAMKRYTNALNRATLLLRVGKVDEAAPEVQLAYATYFEVSKNSNFDSGARQGLASTAHKFHPHLLADVYTKALAKAGHHNELVAFAERYFADYGQPFNPTEVALKKRMEKARGKANTPGS